MSALLENLRYRAESTQVTHQQDEASNTEGKFGIPRFDGNPNMLQEYAYRVKTKIAKEAEMSKDEVSKLGPLGLRLVEGLRGQAFRLAQQVDISVLASSAGPTSLLKTLNDNLKPRKEQEARELYAAGSREGGLLSRQHGEPMSSYVARRTSWWSTLQSLDQELKVPDVLLAEMTLANAGISEDQRLMIRTVLQGRVTTDTIATELLSQHPNIHERERRSGRSKGHGNKGSWRFPPRHKGGHRGFFSEDLQTGVDDWETGSQSLTGFSAVLDEERYDPEYDETLAYVADSQYDMSHDEDEDGFLVMNFALLCEDGLDLQNDEACALAAESLQLEHEAYLLRGHGKGKGHGGFQAQRQFDISGSVSFQERKARLAQLKARTECRRCGAKGHWSGDAACPKGQKKGGSKKHQGTSQTSTRPPQSAQGGKSSNKNAKPRVVYFSHRGDPGQGGFGYMAIKKEPNDDSSRPAGVCVPPPTSLQSSSFLRSSMASSQPSASFADTLTNMVAAAAASNPLVSVPRAEEPARGRSIARDTHYYVQKTYSYSPTSEAESEPDQDHNLPVFLQRSAAEHVPSSPLPADSPTESSTAIMRTSDELDTALLLEALGAGSTEVVHGALQQLTDLEMEVDGEGIATAVMLPPNVQVINPQTLLSAQQVLPPIEALEERRMDQLTEWLDSHSPDDPRYAEASKERWNEFRPGHPLCTEADISNLERWRRNMLAGFRPELQPLPKPLPASAKAASVAAVPVPPQVPGGNPNCEHKNVTKKGSNKHVEMETCRDCNMVLKKVRRDATAVQGQLPGPNTAQQDACPHPRISWKGSNGSQWRNTCTTCGKVATGYYSHTGPHATRKAAGSTLAEAKPLGNFNMDQVEEIFKTCLVVARVKAAEDRCQQMSSGAMHRIMDAVCMTMSESMPSSQPSSMASQADEKDNKPLSFGAYRGRTFQDVLQNERKYVEWCLTQSATSNRKLKEFINYIQRKRNPRFGLMATTTTTAGGSENDLIAILDSGCNRTCHGEKWLKRYMSTVDQHHFPLEPDHGGGFRGIGGAINTTGVRNLDVCFEIGDGMAVGEIDSIELENSDAPLLLSISDQRKLGLTVTLGEQDRVYSSTLQAELIVTNMNGLLGVRLLPKHLAMLGVSDAKPEAQPDDMAIDCDPSSTTGQVLMDAFSTNDIPFSTTDVPFSVPAHEPYSVQQLASMGADLDLDLSVAYGCQKFHQELQQQHETYVAVEEETRKTLSKGQRKFLEQSVEEIQASDVSLWATLTNKKAQTPLPRGCKTFLMEIFAGAAVLTSMAMSLGLPVAAPIDIKLDGTDLLNPKVRAEIESHIDLMDPYCVTFAPVCGPWGSWSRLNLQRGEETREAILQQRDAWYPCLKWIERMVRKRMARGRKFLVENPWPSELWNTLCMDKLICEAPMDVETGEPLELVRGDQCEFGLCDQQNGLPHLKPTGFMTASSGIKNNVQRRCNGNHTHQPLEGGRRTRLAQHWPQALCRAIINGLLDDLHSRTVFAAFHEASTEEADHDGVDLGSLDYIYDEDDMSRDPIISQRVDAHELQRIEAMEEMPNPPDLMELEATRKFKWLRAPRETRVALRRLHHMIGHGSNSAMLQLLRTAGASSEACEAVRHFACETCRKREPVKKPPVVKEHNKMVFNYEISADCFEIHDAAGNRHTVLSVICLGTLYHQAWWVAPGGVSNLAFVLKHC